MLLNPSANHFLMRSRVLMVINLMFSLFELGSEIEQPTFKVILSCSEKTAATQPKLITINEKIINEKV